MSCRTRKKKLHACADVDEGYEGYSRETGIVAQEGRALAEVVENVQVEKLLQRQICSLRCVAPPYRLTPYRDKCSRPRGPELVGN